MSLGCVFFLEFASAQTNHVFNGDFELYDTCPTSESGPFDLQINHCTGWTTPTYATSDYFNSCAVGTNVYVPSNILGYQFPLSGNGYCGFLATSFDTLSNYIWWEYIQGGIQPLSKNRMSTLSINLNRAEDSYY
ncbi:MAG: hypothetical protein HYZ42_15895, partial [Bacteroidetes bacterium]|nr:hypothetical protein [Bacteroidota bacterium]